MIERTEHDLLSAFPPTLAKSERLSTLAALSASALAKLYKDASKSILYPQLSNLAEETCDRLAADLGIRWYLKDADIAVKRAQISSCFFVHRHVGTKSAIIRALRDLFVDTEIFESYEYGGDPYHFKVVFDRTNGGGNPDYNSAESLIDIFKNERSVYDFGLISNFKNALYFGNFEQVETEESIKCSPPFENANFIFVENETFLIDENGELLVE